jgi:outer membrane protein OmpA-like peptidoglycan-associated protein
MGPFLEVFVPDALWLREYVVRLGAARFNARMTVIKLRSGEILVHSPCAFDDSLTAEVASLGRVAAIIAPGNLHLFVDRQAALRPEGAKTLGAVKDLLNKYPTYPLQLTCFTEGQGKQDDLVARSLARANAVFWALVGQGVDPKRMSVDGKGSASPSVDGSATAHVTENAHVELSVLYHSSE